IISHCSFVRVAGNFSFFVLRLLAIILILSLWHPRYRLAHSANFSSLTLSYCFRYADIFSLLVSRYCFLRSNIFLLLSALYCFPFLTILSLLDSKYSFQHTLLSA